jgi:hypothetical protein
VNWTDRPSSTMQAPRDLERTLLVDWTQDQPVNR